MVNPVTGPFTKVESLNYPPPRGSFQTYYRSQVGYKQKPPFDLRLTYNSRLGYSQGTESAPLNASSALGYGGAPVNLNDAKSRAYKKFIDGCQATCQASTALAEYRQSAGMLLDRMKQLVGFARALKRLDFHTAALYLRLSPKQDFNNVKTMMKRRWRRDKDLAAVWLEVHFGWEPLVGDIHDAMEVLTSPATDKTVKGRSTSSWYIDRKVNPPGQASYDFRYQSGVQYIADIRVTNPNLASLTQWGISNPAAVLWELVPFSFVVDWFANVSQMLGTWSDLFGLSTIRPATSIKNDCVMRRWWIGPPGTYSNATYTDTARILSIEKPVLYVKPLKAWSWTRAVTASALLVQLMPKSRTPAHQFGIR